MAKAAAAAAAIIHSQRKTKMKQEEKNSNEMTTTKNNKVDHINQPHNVAKIEDTGLEKKWPIRFDYFLYSRINSTFI